MMIGLARRRVAGATSLIVLMMAFGVLAGVPAVAQVEDGADLPQEPVCPAFPDDAIVVGLPHSRLRSDLSASRAQAGPVAASVPAGTYDVVLTSFDIHWDAEGGWHDHQPREQYKVEGRAAGVAVLVTPPIADLPDTENLLVQQVATGMEVPALDSVLALHSAYPDASSPNSIVPVCVAFLPVEAPTTTTSTSTTSTSTTSTSTTSTSTTSTTSTSTTSTTSTSTTSTSTTSTTQPEESGSIGDRVWLDLDENGIQDEDEPGVAGAIVELVAVGLDDEIPAEMVVGSVTTDADGYYSFEDVPAGSYLVRFTIAGATFTIVDAGGSDDLDSDAIQVSVGFARTGIFELAAGATDLSRDAGIIAPVLGTTVTTSTTIPESSTTTIGAVTVSTLPFTGIESSNLALAGLLIVAAGGLLLASAREDRDRPAKAMPSGWRNR